MKVIYLGAYKALHCKWDITYQDINGKRDIGGDMLEVDLSFYDVIIATPPCNYYSKARGNRKPSKYAEDTKHLLPEIVKKLSSQSKPFIVENVRNLRKFADLGLFDLPIFFYFVGRHTYFTNIPFNPSNIKQNYDFRIHGKKLVSNTQGGDNVHNVIEYWLENVAEVIK